MSRQRTVSRRRFLPAFPLLLLCVVFLAGCESGASFWVVEVEGEDEWMSLSPSYGMVFTGPEEGASPRLLLREGDFLFSEGEDLFIPILASDTGSLDLVSGENMLTLGGKPVALELRRGEEEWAWLRNATPEELATLRMIDVSAERTPEDAWGELGQHRMALLERLASSNPDLGLTTGFEIILPQLLRIFDPETLDLSDADVEEGLGAILAQEPNLKTLMISGEDVTDLEFLGRTQHLEKLLITLWNPEEIGPLPDSLPKLKSVIVILPTMEDLSSIGIQPYLEELTVLICEEGDESELLDIGALADYPTLKTVSLPLCPVAGDLSIFDGLEDLSWLGLPWNTTQEELEHVIRTHPDLAVLLLIGPGGITDLTPLTDLRSLRALMVGSTAPPDPLFGMDNLEYLAVVVENDEVSSFGADVLPRLQAELPTTIVTRVDPAEFCLGSGFILLLVPMVGGAWWVIRRRRRGRKPVPHHG